MRPPSRQIAHAAARPARHDMPTRPSARSVCHEFDLQLLAIDLGAESGRAVLGRFDGERITLEPYHRFSNGAVPVLGRLYWDILHLYREIRVGLGMARRVADGELASIGLDTWGVDFGLLDAKNALVENPRHYRDPRNDGILERAYAMVPREEIFAQTGLQFMEINTLFQLLA